MLRDHPPLPGRKLVPSGCYMIEFTGWMIRDGVLGTQLARSLPLCTDGEGNSTLPTLADPNAPPPAPASDVRIVRDGASWYVEWRDNSSDEMAFPVLFVLSDGAGDFVRRFDTKARMNATSVLVPRQRFSELPEGSCFSLHVWVFAERFDKAHGPGRQRGRARVCERKRPYIPGCRLRPRDE